MMTQTESRLSMPSICCDATLAAGRMILNVCGLFIVISEAVEKSKYLIIMFTRHDISLTEPYFQNDCTKKTSLVLV